MLGVRNQLRQLQFARARPASPLFQGGAVCALGVASGHLFRRVAARLRGFRLAFGRRLQVGACWDYRAARPVDIPDLRAGARRDDKAARIVDVNPNRVPPARSRFVPFRMHRSTKPNLSHPQPEQQQSLPSSPPRSLPQSLHQRDTPRPPRPRARRDLPRVSPSCVCATRRDVVGGGTFRPFLPSRLARSLSRSLALL